MLTRLIECLLCRQFFSEEDVTAGRFYATTRVCHDCYTGMATSSFSVSCFGKRSRGTKLGFEQNAVECREICKDRKICAAFVSIQGVKVASPYRAGSAIDKIFKMCQHGTTVDNVISICKKADIGYGRVLRDLRSGGAKGIKWKWEEDNGKIRIR